MLFKKNKDSEIPPLPDELEPEQKIVPNESDEKMLEKSFNDSDAKEETTEDPIVKLNDDLKDIENELNTTESSIKKIDKQLDKLNKKVN